MTTEDRGLQNLHRGSDSRCRLRREYWRKFVKPAPALSLAHLTNHCFAGPGGVSQEDRGRQRVSRPRANDRRLHIWSRVWLACFPARWRAMSTRRRTASGPEGRAC